MGCGVGTTKRQRGAILLPAILAIGALLGIGALAVDLGVLVAGRTQLQTAADAAALAAAKELAFGRVDLAVRRAVDYAGQNETLGEPVELDRLDDVAIGYWSYREHAFTADAAAPNAVRITARRVAARHSGITTWFGQLIGVPEVDAGARATAVALPRDVVVVIDRSGDMGADPSCCGNPDDPPIYAARAAAATFFRDLSVSTLPERAGLVTYALHAEVSVPIGSLDRNLPALLTAANTLEAAPCGAEGSTSTGTALDTGLELFDGLARFDGGPAGTPMIVLLSNGVANRDSSLVSSWGEEVHADPYDPDTWPESWHYAVRAAVRAGDAGVAVHTIVLGLTDPDDPACSRTRDMSELERQRYEELKRQLMRAIAGASGGFALEAPTPDDLGVAFGELSKLVRVALVE
jgi:hypothetical protein